MHGRLSVRLTCTLFHPRSTSGLLIYLRFSGDGIHTYTLEGMAAILQGAPTAGEDSTTRNRSRVKNHSIFQMQSISADHFWF